MTPSATIIAPPDWSAVGPRGHAVQFYGSDGQLLDLLTRFAGTALITGDVSIVIATKTHRDGLGKRLKARGLDARVPRGQGRFITLDAEATLARFTVDGRLDRRRFRQVIGGVLDGIVAKGERRRIAAFGEMVALLWAAGRVELAIELEEMWNELAKDYAFTLCCAYPMNAFGSPHVAPFMKICAQHSHVFTAAKAADIA